MGETCLHPGAIDDHPLMDAIRDFQEVTEERVGIMVRLADPVDGGAVEVML